MMRDFYFLFHSADEDDANTRPFSEAVFKRGKAILVNLDQAYALEAFSEKNARPTRISFGEEDFLVWETVEEIDRVIYDRRLQLISEFGNRP